MTPKKLFRAAIADLWTRRLRAIGFVGRPATTLRRTLRDAGLCQILDLQWSRYNADEEARVRVHAGVGPLPAEDVVTTFGIDACPATISAALFHGQGGDYWYVFGNRDTRVNQLSRLHETPADWALRRYDYANESALRWVLKADIEQVFIPFFESLATRDGYDRFRRLPDRVAQVDLLRALRTSDA